MSSHYLTVDALATEPSETAASQASVNARTSVAHAEERELVRRARSDRDAFAQLYRIHYDAIAGYLYRRTGRRDATEDLVADTFLLALRHLSRYRDRGLSFRSWLYRIATNEANTWSRRRRRAHRNIDDCPEVVDQRNESEREALDSGWPRRALRRLSPRFQAVLALYYLEDMSVSEVAAVLGCRAGTIRSRLSRGRQALRVELEKEESHAPRS